MVSLPEIAASGPTARPGAGPAERLLARRPGNGQRIPGIFQLLLGLYIILTSSFPTIVQGLAFGVDGAAGSEFSIAMVTSLVRDLLILAPVLILANHPLGILHPLLLGVVVWPLLVEVPAVIQEYGGWAGIMAGVPVAAPFFTGLPSHAATTVWIAIAKYNALEILALVCAYAGFWFFKGSPRARFPVPQFNTQAVRFILIGLIGFSIFVLLLLVSAQGGLGEHLASLGRGRFRALSSVGFVMFITDLGAIALYVWIAARPDDVKSPLFLSCFAIVVTAQFVSNGSRSSALDVPMMVGLIWALRKQRVPWRTGLLLIPLFFVLLGLLGAVRSASWHGQTAGEVLSNAGFAESFAAAQQDIEERRAQSAQVPIIERGFEVTGGPLLGRSYIAAFVAFVPRNLWENKPRGPDSLYTPNFLGAPKEGFGIPVSSEAELYWNFGIYGLVLFSLVYGGLLRWAYNGYWRRYPAPVAIVFYALFVTSFHFSTRHLVGLQQHLVLLLFCTIVLAIFVPRSRNSAGPVNYQPSVQAAR